MLSCYLLSDEDEVEIYENISLYISLLEIFRPLVYLVIGYIYYSVTVLQYIVVLV